MIERNMDEVTPLSVLNIRKTFAKVKVDKAI